MANELGMLWANKNEPQYEINAANLTFMAPSLMCMDSRIFTPLTEQRGQITMAGDFFTKIVNGGIHQGYRNGSALTFSPATKLDQGSVLQAGTDYYIYLVRGSESASIVVSLNSTFPVGASADNSRKIGGFHTLCADAGTNIANHPLSGYMAGDILPQSVWDLIHRPECSPEGMVFHPDLQFWVDIYMQSGSGSNTRSQFQGTVTKSQSFDSHQEDLYKVGKQMLTDQEFTAAAWGTVPFSAVNGVADPITTGGKINTAGQRIISHIGCEDTVGCYWQWIDMSSCYMAGALPTPAWTDAVPADQGQQYMPLYSMLAGGSWSNGPFCGPRCRNANLSRSHVLTTIGCRGRARSRATR